MCPRLPTVPWELYLWTVMHCGTGAVKRDKGIKQELSFRKDPIHLAGTQRPVHVTSPDSPRTESGLEASDCSSLGCNTEYRLKALFNFTVQNMHTLMETFSWDILIEVQTQRQQMAPLCLESSEFLLNRKHGESLFYDTCFLCRGWNVDSICTNVKKGFI